MKNTLLYILLHFSSAVLADWITVEHAFKMCDVDVPSVAAALHIDDDGVTYSTSLLVRNVETVKHEPSLTTLNVTMWGCTYDCHFSFMLNISRDDLSVSSYTDKNLNNYKCNFSNYTMKLIPTPKIAYKQKTPNPDHVFPTHLTAQYCSAGKHPDDPNWPINKTDSVAECIDNLTGHEVGSYAASLQFGTGSSFKPDGYGVATYHMINSANKLFNYWESHHRGFHEALNELSMKMTTDNLKELKPPPPPPPKENKLLKIVGIVSAIVLLAVPFCITAPLVIEEAAVAAGEVVETTVVEVSETAAEISAADETIANPAVGAVARNAAIGWRNAALKNRASLAAKSMANQFKRIKDKSFGCSLGLGCKRTTIRGVADYYDETENPKIALLITALKREGTGGASGSRGPRKRDTMDNIGFFTVNMVNVYFLPTLMDNVHKSFTGDGQVHPDISSYLSAASESLQFHFEDTLHNNFFTVNKSVLASFTAHQGLNYDQLLGNADDIYTSVKQSTYYNMAASIISDALRMYNVEICDPKPSFCGQPCDSGHVYCPTIGNDSCVITATDSQINELRTLRDTSDICSKDNSTGWDINHNPKCDIKQFQCK